MAHFFIIILIIIVISIIDGTILVKKQLNKELFAFAAFAIVILVYSFLYFSGSYNASIANILNKILVQR